MVLPAPSIRAKPAVVTGESDINAASAASLVADIEPHDLQRLRSRPVHLPTPFLCRIVRTTSKENMDLHTAEAHYTPFLSRNDGMTVSSTYCYAAL
jgi:hypothetical protein